MPCRRQEEHIYQKAASTCKSCELERFRGLILYNLEAGEAVLTDNNDVQHLYGWKKEIRSITPGDLCMHSITFTCNITLSRMMSFGRRIEKALIQQSAEKA